MPENVTLPFAPPPPEHRPHLIPAWLVPLLGLPLRRIWDNPAHIILPLIQSGHRVLEVGPGSGFFTIPMGQKVGPNGHLFCVELQESVRRRLIRKVSRRTLADRIEVRPCAEFDLQILDLEESLDLAVAIDVLHEVPDPARTIQQMVSALCLGGGLLIREPKGHCPEAVFKAEIAWAIQAGLVQQPGPWDLGSRGQLALFRKDNAINWVA
jgi:SAM-dependent methyltransferase